MRILQGAHCLLVAPDISEIRLVEMSLKREGMEVTRRPPFELPEDISELPDADVVIADGDALPGREPQDFAAQIGTPVLWLSTRRLELDSRTVTTLKKPFSPPELVMMVREMIPEETVEASGEEPTEAEPATEPTVEAEVQKPIFEPPAEPPTEAEPPEFEPEPIEPEPEPEPEARAAEPQPEPEPEPFVPARVILDLASGSGRSTVEIAQDDDDALVIGIDRSEDAIMRAHRRLKKMDVRNAAFVVADLTALPFGDNAVDDAQGFEDIADWVNEADLSQAYLEIDRVCRRQLWEEPPMTAQEPQAGQDISLSDLRANNPDIRAAALVTADGFAVEADCGPDVDEESLAALAADLLARASRSSEDFDNGRLDELYARGEEGFLVVERAGEDQVLACLASAEATIGLLLRDVRQTASALVE